MSHNQLLPLSAIEIRLLGCLIEKQHTTPNQYPLTLNSLQLACNQKTSRNPIMQLETGEIGAALNQLIEKTLVTKHPFSARAEKFEQQLDRQLGLSEPRLAILCTLMLRGDQTLAEIKANTQRIHAFDDIQTIKSHIEGLLLQDEPLIIELPKKPGAKEVRFMHLLEGSIDIDKYMQTPISSTVKHQSQTDLMDKIEQLEVRLQKLEAHLGLDHPEA